MKTATNNKHHRVLYDRLPEGEVSFESLPKALEAEKVHHLAVHRCTEQLMAFLIPQKDARAGVIARAIAQEAFALRIIVRHAAAAARMVAQASRARWQE